MRTRLLIFLQLSGLTILICLGFIFLNAGECDNTTLPSPHVAINGTMLWPTPIELIQADSTNFRFWIERFDGYSDDIAPYVDTSRPAGITARFEPSPMTAADDTCVLTLLAAVDADTGLAGLRLVCGEESVPFSLDILPFSSFTVSLAQNPFSLEQGSSGAVMVAIDRHGGFSEPVALTLDYVPSGVTHLFEPATTTDDSSVLSFTADLSTTVEQRHLVLTATGGGLTYTLGFSLIILEASAPVYWTQMNTVTGNKLFDVFFADLNTVYAVGEAGTVIKSSNGGQDWTDLHSSGTTRDLYGVHFTHPDTGTVVGTGGTILKTVNGGAAWSPQGDITESLRQVQLVDSDHGFIVGDDGMLVTTADGGTTWVGATHSPDADLWALWFHDHERGVMAGGEGSVLQYTTDSFGTVQVSQIYTCLANYTDFHFPTENRGFLVGGPYEDPRFNGQAAVLRSDSLTGGWDPLLIGTTEFLHGVAFRDRNLGVVVGDNGAIYGTRTSGDTWQPENSSIWQPLYAVDWIAGQRAIAVGNAGVIVRRNE
ncbi:MAG: YCF48-related protein [bacterium]